MSSLCRGNPKADSHTLVVCLKFCKKGSGVLGREVDLLAKGCVGLVDVGET